MTMTEEKEGPSGPDREPPLTGPIGSAPEDATPPPSGTTPPAPGHYLARVGVPAVPHRWGTPKRAHRRRRRFPWLVLLLGTLAVSLSGLAMWAYLSDAPPPPAGQAGQVTVQNIPRLREAMGQPAEPSRTAITSSSARVALFDIPALGIRSTLADGIDPGTGPVLWPGTPWPGGPGRAVVLVWADLSTLRPGHEVLVGEGAGYATWRVATVRQVAEDAWDTVARQSVVPELALVEAGSFRPTRTLVIAWPVP